MQVYEDTDVSEFLIKSSRVLAIEWLDMQVYEDTDVSEFLPAAGRGGGKQRRAVLSGLEIQRLFIARRNLNMSHHHTYYVTSSYILFQDANLNIHSDVRVKTQLEHPFGCSCNGRGRR